MLILSQFDWQPLRKSKPRRNLYKYWESLKSADKKGGWGPKRPKICWRNIGMVPILPSLITYIQSSLYLEILGHPEKTTLPKDDLVHNPHLLNSPSFSLLNLSNSLGIIISGQLLFQINNNGKLSKHSNTGYLIAKSDK